MNSVRGAPANSSLWGKKIPFSVRERCVWQLQPGVVVPGLKELSVCILFRLNYTTEWTGFVYKAPGKKHIELGLQGTAKHLAVWLFGDELRLDTELKLYEWNSVCLTWSGAAQRLRVYVNGTSRPVASLKPTLQQQLAQNGTLTLGVTHYIDGNGKMKLESGNNLLGEIGLFSMWSRERSAEELSGQSCADGDVLSWDTKQWQVFACGDRTTTNCEHWCIYISKLDIETDTTSWAHPDMTNCYQVVSIPGLHNITVTTGNAAEVVDMIQDLVDVQLGNGTELSASDLDMVVEKLNEVANISIIQPSVGVSIVKIVADILLSSTDITPVANIVLNLTERIGNNMYFLNESVSVTAPWLALSMVNVDPDEFNGFTFGVSSDTSTLRPKIFLNQSFVSEPLPDKDAIISLPSELHNFLNPGQHKKTRIQFNFYGTQELFQDPRTNNTTQSTWTLNSHIISASINNSHVSNLKGVVVLTLNHQTPKRPKDKVQCVFWDFQKNGGQGGWNSRGCETRSISSYQTSCLCDHLTHFAVLLDVSRTSVSGAHLKILTVISYLGCGVSSIFLGITLLTYLAFDKLRRDYPSKILINLSAALLGLSMLFLLDSWLSSFSNYGLCIATGATLHYFLLASFTWMGLEAVHMYLALVKVFNIYIPSYILKFCAVGWGVPLVIVSLVLAIDKDAYGNTVPEETGVALQSTDAFCWLQNDAVFYVTVIAFVLLILLCNLSVFITVLIQIRQMKANKPPADSCSSLRDLRTVASLTVLLGLTWTMGFFIFGPNKLVLMYLFCIFNTLQGFFVFLFHCLMKENVRKQWRIHLCCGRFRLSDYTDGSRTVTVGGHRKQNNLVNSDSVASDSTSTTRKVSGSSAESELNHHQGA
ncbi:adhesion G protein-coupled receptor G4a [Chaetodon auriga]|uniref:adhesion G protein-coupled receptor G4a n=1 Tax=Chaetodon auriga TaxID=39042 RepID=UPI0040328A86